MKKIILSIIFIIFALQIVLSYFDIVADNNTSNPQHHEYNFFQVMLDITDKKITE